MIKNIITSPTLLSRKSENIVHPYSTSEIVQDLTDTAKAQTNPECLGLAANQIGSLWRIFVMKFGMEWLAIVNPEIICMGGGISSAPESCLSRPGMKPIRVRRHKMIKIQYIENMKVSKVKKFQGLDARIVQHEMDHFKGILV